MSGIDHTMADVAQRECLALTGAMKQRVYEAGGTVPGVLGLAVLSTCNRTELYLSLEEGAQVAPFSILAGVLGFAPPACLTLRGKDVYDHLSSLACGVQSRIFGEDQILAQVKDAASFARSCGALDSVLEVLFRSAVTAAKKAKTLVRVEQGQDSAATAVQAILSDAGDIRRVLVIGNGEMGRLTAGQLARAGFEVSMTLRQYRHGSVLIPDGVKAVDYDRRYEVLPLFDAVVSATTSPHCTLTLEQLSALPRRPWLYLDLAIPRDIEPEISSLPGVTVYDIDQVADRTARRQLRREHLDRISPILAEGWAEFSGWEQRREKLRTAPLKTRFPLFVDVTGRGALVVGGGRIATRRASTLCQFTFDVTVVAPQVSEQLERMERDGKLAILRRPFEDDDLDGAFLAVAATDDRAVNHRIASLCRHLGVYASIADKREECSIYFPAVAENDKVTVGVCGDGVAHQNVSAAAKKIREVLDETS